MYSMALLAALIASPVTADCHSYQVVPYHGAKPCEHFPSMQELPWSFKTVHDRAKLCEHFPPMHELPWSFKTVHDRAKLCEHFPPKQALPRER
jgi:hypothetical protein